MQTTRNYGNMENYSVKLLTTILSCALFIPDVNRMNLALATLKNFFFYLVLNAVSPSFITYNNKKCVSFLGPDLT